MKCGLDEKTIRKFHSVFSKFSEIEEVVLYGSRALGNYREGSDIDLTMKGENVDDRIRSRVLWLIDDLNTPYLVDLSIFHRLDSVSLVDHIERVGKVFYKKRDDLHGAVR